MNDNKAMVEQVFEASSRQGGLALVKLAAFTRDARLAVAKTDQPPAPLSACPSAFRGEQVVPAEFYALDAG